MDNIANNYTLFEILERGGWSMVPLVVCSIVALAVVIERSFWGVRRSRVIPGKFLRRIDELLGSRRLDELQNLCAMNNSPLSRIVSAGLRSAGRSRNEVTDALELAGRREYSLLLKNVGTLGTIAAISPLLGLLGTVIGIIRTFAVIEKHGIGNPQLLAGGISEALISTASGICVAVPSVIFYRFFRERARQLTFELEEFTLELLTRIAAAVNDSDTRGDDGAAQSTPRGGERVLKPAREG